MTQKTINANEINAIIRLSIVERLPDAIEIAIESYHNFVLGGAVKTLDDEEQGSAEINKNFKAHHDACKVALAHINLLLDLAKELLAHLEDTDDTHAAVDALTRAVQSAQMEITGKA